MLGLNRLALPWARAVPPRLGAWPGSHCGSAFPVRLSSGFTAFVLQPKGSLAFLLLLSLVCWCFCSLSGSSEGERWGADGWMPTQPV